MMFGLIETHKLFAVAFATVSMVGVDYLYRMLARIPYRYRFTRDRHRWPVRASIEALSFSAFVFGVGVLIAILATAMEKTLSQAEFTSASLMLIIMILLYPFAYGCILMFHRSMDELYIDKGDDVKRRDVLPFIGASIFFVSAMWIGIYIGLLVLGTRIST